MIRCEASLVYATAARPENATFWDFGAESEQAAIDHVVYQALKKRKALDRGRVARVVFWELRYLERLGAAAVIKGRA